MKRLIIDDSIEKNVHYNIDFTKHGEVTILAQSLKSKRTKMADYYTEYNYKDGYKIDDIIEIYRILDEFIEELKDG